MLVLVFRSKTVQRLNPLYQNLNSHVVPHIHFLLRWWGEIVEVSTRYVIMSLIIVTNLFTLTFQADHFRA